MAALLASVAGSAVAGGSNMISSLGTAGIQAGVNYGMQQSAQDYNDKIIKGATDSFTKYGLPEFMAYQSGGSGNSGTIPAMKFSLGGGNYQQGGPVGSNLPVFTTPYQQYLHQGTPNKQINFVRAGAGTSGQNDRVGLGAGRYSAAPPPNATYNSVGTQFSPRMTSTETQATGTQTRLPNGGLIVRNSTKTFGNFSS